MTGGVEKRCGCPEDRWPKCKDPWYLKQVLHQGHYYEPNLTRYARVVLNRTFTTKAEAEDVARIVRTAIHAGTYISAKGYRPPTEALAEYGQTLDVIAKSITRRVETDISKSKGARQETHSHRYGCVTQRCRAPAWRAADQQRPRRPDRVSQALTASRTPRGTNAAPSGTVPVGALVGPS